MEQCPAHKKRAITFSCNNNYFTIHLFIPQIWLSSLLCALLLGVPFHPHHYPHLTDGGTAQRDEINWLWSPKSGVSSIFQSKSTFIHSSDIFLLRIYHVWARYRIYFWWLNEYTNKYGVDWLLSSRHLWSVMQDIGRQKGNNHISWILRWTFPPTY